MEELNNKEEVKKLSEFPMHRDNPFVDNLMVESKRKIIGRVGVGKKAIVNMESGEVESSLVMGISQEVDKEEFVKLYLSSLQIIFGLSKKALKVLSYLINVNEIQKDTVLFDMEDCMIHTDYTSKATLISGITELLSMQIIARGKAKNLYFINPSVFYRGDRIILVREYKKKKSSKYETPKNQLTLFNNKDEK